MTIEKIYTLQEVMEILKVSVQVATAEVTTGRLKAFRVGRQWRIKESSLQEYIDNDVEPLIGDLNNDPEVMDEIPPEVVKEMIPIDADAEFIEEVPDNTEHVPPAVQEQPATPEDANKTIILMKADGKTLIAIAEYLNSVGSTNKGKAWNKDSVNRVCQKNKAE